MAVRSVMLVTREKGRDRKQWLISRSLPFYSEREDPHEVSRSGDCRVIGQMEY